MSDESNASNPQAYQQVAEAAEIRFSTRGKFWTIAILAGLLVAFLLHISEELPPFVWALVTAYILNKILTFFTSRFGGKRWIWAGGVFLSFFVLLSLGLLFLIPAVTKEARLLTVEAPLFKQKVDRYLDENPNLVIGGVELTSQTARSAINNVLDRLPEIAGEFGPGLLSKTFRFLISLLLYLIVTFYLTLLGGRNITKFIISLPLKYRAEIAGLIKRANFVLGAYLRAQLLLIAIMSVASFITLSILGVKYSLLLGIMVGVLELIPFVGPYLAITICSLVAFFQDKGNFGLSGFGLVTLVVALLFILRQIEDYAVIPNVVGRVVELPALLVIFSVVSGAALLGPMGLLLAVPIVALVKIIVGYLFYKLVDADRQKVVIENELSFEGLCKFIESLPAHSRLLLIVPEQAEYLTNKTKLNYLHQFSSEKAIDIAFYVGQDEKILKHIEEANFPVITMEQEHFLAAKAKLFKHG